MISIRELQKSFGPNQVLKNLSWDIDEGSIHGLVGLNGSGKSTLLRIIAGVTKPDQGEVLKNNIPFNKRMLMFVETEPFFYHGINGKEYLSLFRNENKTGFNDTGWAELFHLPLDKLIDDYSTGMKKKLALLAALKTSRSVLLLDEPYNGLDLESSRILTSVLQKIKGPDKTIIITSHMLETLGNICDKIHYLSDGVIKKSYLQDQSEEMADDIFHEFDQRTEARIVQLLSGA